MYACSHQCPPGRRHCQCRFLQGFPEEGLAPHSYSDRCSEAWLSKCFSPWFSLDDLLLGVRFDDTKALKLSLEDTVMVSCSFRAALTASLAGLLGKVACLAAFFSWKCLSLFAERLNADGVFFFLDFFPTGLTGNDPGTTLSCVTLLVERIHFTNKDTLSEFLLIFQWYW